MAAFSFSSLPLARPLASVPSKINDCGNSWPSSQEEPFSTVLHRAKESWIGWKRGDYSLFNHSVDPVCAMCAACTLGIQRGSLGIQRAQVRGVRLVTGRDPKFAAESALPKKPHVFLYAVIHKNIFKPFSSVWSDFLGAKFDICIFFWSPGSSTCTG